MSEDRKSIAILGLNRQFVEEPRIRHEIDVFSPHFAIHGYGGSTVEGLSEFVAVPRPPRLLDRFFKLVGGLLPSLRVWFETLWYRRLARLISMRGYRFLIPHHLDDGIVALATGTPFLFHSHEYLPRQFDGSWLFRFTEMRYRRLVLMKLLQAAILTVTEGDKVSGMYAETFGVALDRFIVLPSMPAFRPALLRRAPLPHGINLIHHGWLVPQRGIELLMAVASALGAGYTLTLMGPGLDAYVESLKAKAAAAGNIRILSPVPYDEIVETLHGYDLGLVIFGSPHFHHKHTTVPNKFWECLQARVPVLVSPDSAMADIVRRNGCGVVAAEACLAGYVEAVKQLTGERIADLKARCESLAWEHSRDSWRERYASQVISAVAAYEASRNANRTAGSRRTAGDA